MRREYDIIGDAATGCFAALILIGMLAGGVVGLVMEHETKVKRAAKAEEVAKAKEAAAVIKLKQIYTAQIYMAQTSEELPRIMKLYGCFDKQKTAQFGVFARRMDKLNQRK